jgi:hypothetical protein
MWQGASRNHRHLLERVSLEYFHCVQSTDRYIGKLAIRVASEVDVMWPFLSDEEPHQALSDPKQIPEIPGKTLSHSGA